MTARIFKTPSTVKLPKQKQEWRHDEYGKSKKGLAVCPTCHNVKFKKEWHHPDSSLVVQSKIGWEKGVHFVTCPACTMGAKGLYEGEITIVGVPPRLEGELAHLIAAYGARAIKRDPQDRVLNIKKIGKKWLVHTTEDELAVKLAKKIKGVFNKIDLEINYLKEPQEVSRIRITFI